MSRHSEAYRRLQYTAQELEQLDNHLLYKDYKSIAASSGLVFELTQEQCTALSLSPCFYCRREPYKWNFGRKRTLIDRVNTINGYLNNNVVSACQSCYFAKQGANLMRLEKLSQIYARSILFLRRKQRGEAKDSNNSAPRKAPAKARKRRKRS